MSGPKYVDGKEVGPRKKPPTAEEMNKAASEFWAQPVPLPLPSDEAWQSERDLVTKSWLTVIADNSKRAKADAQSEKARNAKPGADAKKKQGQDTRDKVEKEAGQYRGSRHSRERVAQLVAPKVELSESRTLKILRELKIPK
jgi:hypothetical protein